MKCSYVNWIVNYKNFHILTVCSLDLQYDDETCYNMTHSGRIPNATALDEVKKLTTNLEVYDGVLVSIPSVIFCLFLGSWSDANGRKLLLVLPFVGNGLSFIAYMICYSFPLPSKALLLGSVVGLSGGYICLNIGLYGYIGDVTSAENRTSRMSILNGVFSLGYVAGTTIGGQLYKHFANYYLNFGVSLGLAFFGAGYAAFLIPESVDVNSASEEVRSRKFFDLANVKESLRTTFKDRPGRIRIIFLIINFAIFMFPLNTTHYDYLLVKDRYNWDVVHFSNYLTVQRICRFLGLFVILPLVSKLLGIQDSLVASVGTVGTIVAYLLIAIGDPSWTGPNGDWDPGWVMYLSAALQFNSVITVAIRSQCTKEVDKDEIGRIFSVVALGQAIVPLVCNPIFGAISNATIDTLPGAYQLVVAGLLVFVFLSSCYMSIDQLRRSRPDQVADQLL